MNDAVCFDSLVTYSFLILNVYIKISSGLSACLVVRSNIHLIVPSELLKPAASKY